MKINDTRFMVRETKSGLKKLDWALNIMGYSSRSDWYREKKREIIREAEKKAKER
jgi:metal-responsive CopG/Arc/MetJ family transcriptional regulator